MLQIGLTGGIASGKTMAAKQFAKLGAPVIDADVITRELMKPDTVITQQIINHFGNGVLDKTGQLNRSKLAEIIFNDLEQKQWIEQLIHPAVRERMQSKIDALNKSPYCILVIPLLIETLPNPMIQRVVVVDCDEAQQLKRLQKRDQLTEQQAKKIIATQASREQRLKLADDIINNTTEPSKLAMQVKQLHNYYLEIAN